MNDTFRFNDGTICTIEVFICASTGGTQRIVVR